MDEEALQQILAAEEVIRQQLAAERQRASRWLDGLRLDGERQRQEAAARKAAGRAAAIAGSEEEAARAAAWRLEQAAGLAARLRDLPQALLEAILRRHLTAILPEAGHDR
ncbi:MAG: hypothetical protein AB1634_04185 [Thermodesulfobacteriota bacterium]